MLLTLFSKFVVQLFVKSTAILQPTADKEFLSVIHNKFHHAVTLSVSVAHITLWGE